MWRVVVAAAVLLVLPTYAFAAAPVIAVLAEGPDAASVRQALVDLVPKGVTTADAGAFQASLAHTGQKGPIGKQIEGGGRAKAVKRLTEAAKDVGAVAVLLGRVTRTKKARKVNLIIVEASGEVPLDADVDLGSKPDSADGAALDAALAGALQKYAPADKAETKPAGKDAPKEEAKKEDSDEGKEAEGAPPPESAKDTSPWQFRARPLIDLEATVGAGGRHFGYNDGVSTNLRTYSLFPAPWISVRGQIFPLARMGGVLGDIGIIGGYSVLPFVSSTVGTTTLNTNFSGYAVGLRARMHPSGDTGPQLGVSVSYASTIFGFDNAGALAGTLPSETYNSIRPALDGRVSFGNFSVLANVGFRFPISASGLTERFRGPTVGGVDAELGGALVIAHGLELRLYASYERYFLAFKPTPGDAFVAGGALDELYGARVGIAYSY